MPKINREEYEVLKGLDDRWKWIARNYNGALIIYTSKPMENPNLYWDGFGERMDDKLFKFIQWEDEEPHNIAELIEEYLYDSQPKLFIDGQEQSFDIIEESEETEVKDLEWVKSKLKKDHKDGEVAKSQIKDGEKIDGIDLNSYWRGRQTANYIARCYLEDLDEPETLSEDWIQEHSYNVHLLGTPDVTTVAVPRDDLQNLLVPKQIKPKELYKAITGISPSIEEVCDSSRTETFIDESVSVERIVEAVMETVGPSEPEKPVIPKFVADWIEKYIEYGYDLYLALKKMENNSRSWKKTYDWYRKNTHTFVNAYLTGKYEVEEEQKYYVLDSEEIPLLERVNNQTCKTTTGLSIYEDGRDNSRFELTEQEIKDYDPRYMAFAKPVEELEE